jgi:putative acyl-CoA dehydrogenase
LETLGGNGYVEESLMPRLYREAPVNSVWEGSGNVICLDVLRALTNEPETAVVLLDEIKQVAGQNKELDAQIAQVELLIARKSEREARQMVEQLAVLLQAKLLIESAPSAVSDAFIASRIKGGWGRTFGTLSADVDTLAILERAF